MSATVDLAIRVDGDAAIGFGHAMRSATLARACRAAGYRVAIVTDSFPDHIARTAIDEGVLIAPDFDVLPFEPDVVVVDGYHLGAEAVHLRQRDGIVLAMIDDNRELPVELADVVVNQNLHALGLYRDLLDVDLLLGHEYVMLRPEVTALREVREGGRVLVSFGGADPLRLSLPVVRGLLADQMQTVVAVSAAHPDREALLEHASESGGQLLIDRGDLIDGLSLADVAVIGGGTTMYEAAHLGIPAFATIVADNQRSGTVAAERAGLLRIVTADPPSIVSAVRSVDRVSTDRPAERLIDGLGAVRVVQALQYRSSS